MGGGRGHGGRQGVSEPIEESSVDASIVRDSRWEVGARCRGLEIGVER